MEKPSGDENLVYSDGFIPGVSLNTSTPPTDGRNRLDSWKEIAAYLNRDIRTVQRWEKNGLPVHRVSSGSNASVFAHPSELDRWLHREESTTQSLRQPRSRRRYLAAAVVVVAGLLTLAFWFGNSMDTGPINGGSVEHKWVLVADFAGATGDPDLAGALRFALERELAASRWLNAASTDRVRDTLLGMRKPLDSFIDEIVGREVCLRDGAIEALIVGRLERLDPIYRVSLRLVDPVSNATLAATSLDAENRDGILESIRELARWVRVEFGETVPARKDKALALERVTTRSLKALELYTKGVHAYLDAEDPNRRTKSEALFREALEIDPEFALAQLLLAWSLAFQWAAQGEAFESAARRALPELEKAVELADLTSQPERHFILGCYHDWKQEYETAAVHYELVIDLAPDHHWAMNNLERVNHFLGRETASARYWVKVADARPNHFYAQHEAADYLLGLQGRDAAEPYLRRARELLDRDPQNHLPAAYGSVLTFRMWDRWLENDMEGALSEANRVRDLLESSGAGKSKLARQACWLGLQYLMLGRLQDARELRTEFSIEFLHFNGYLAWTSGGNEAPAGIPPDAPLVWLRVDPSRKERFENQVGRQSTEEREHLLRGKLAMLDGRFNEGVALLEKGVRMLDNPDGNAFDLGLGSLELADAYWNRGDLHGAISLLEAVSRRRTFFCHWGAGLIWLQVEARLAELYRRAERPEDAKRLEDELRILLSAADPDHPILKRLPQTQTSDSPKKGSDRSDPENFLFWRL